jgi:ParB/RepB/Spo0J family partition protein
MIQLTLQEIPLSAIQLTRRNPRSDPDDDLDGLAASLGSKSDPRLAQPPVVEQAGKDAYRLIAGERRVRAAKRAGWQTIPCLVRPPLDPLAAHTLRLVENLHRKDLHPLDEAAALKIAWLSANAEALGLGEAVRNILNAESTPPQTLDALQTLLAGRDFCPNRPAVAWDVVLDRLGLSLNPERRKKLLAVLAVDSSVQEQMRTLDVTEAAVRAIGTLETPDQARLAAEIAAQPELARKARRIARVVREGAYSLDEAIAEAKGQVLGDGGNTGELSELLPDEVVEMPDLAVFDDRATEAVMQLLEAANQVSVSLAALGVALSGKELVDLPPPWGEYAQDALNLIRDELRKFEQRG